MKQVTISNQQLNDILSEITTPSARRLVTLLSGQQDVQSVVINRSCCIANISHTARVRANPILYKFGLIVGCHRPPIALKNRFGETSGQYLWSLYQLPDACRDPVYSAVGDTRG